MTASGARTLCLTIALATAASASPFHAADPWPVPRPIANDLPAFRAPEEPPDAGAPPQEPLPPEPAAPLALADALALALMRNPDLAASSWEVRASEGRTLKASKLPNPDLEVRLYQVQQPATSPDPEEGRLRVILDQRFELGGKRHRRVELGEIESNLAGWDYEAKRIEVATTVTSQFAAVLGAQRKVATWGELVTFLTALRGRVASLIASGALRSLEVHELTRRLGLAQIERDAAESELAAARFRLAATWGARSPRFTEASGELGPPTPLPDIAAVLELARQGPTIARWDAEVARGEAGVALAKAGRVPDLRAGIGARWIEDVSTPDYLLDFAVALPLLDRKQGETREAQASVARARAAKTSAEAACSAGIADSYYRVQASMARVARLADEVVPAIRAIFDSQQQGLELGPTSLEGLLDARRDLARAEVQHTEALVDYHQARASLEGLVGRTL